MQGCTPSAASVAGIGENDSRSRLFCQSRRECVKSQGSGDRVPGSTGVTQSLSS